MKKLSLAQRMLIGMVTGIAFGAAMMAFRESGSASWKTISNLLFADVTAAGNEKAIGLFYVVSQLFVRSLQVIIVPMVFTSITLAIAKMNDAKKLGRVSSKTIGTMFLTSSVALVVAGIVGAIVYKAGLFGSGITVDGLSASTGSTGSNPLGIIINAVPNNIGTTFSSNSSVLALVFLAVCTGLCINKLGEKITVLPKLCQEISDIVTVFLSFIVEKFGPVAIFMLLSRAMAVYGIQYLAPAFTYMILAFALLLVYLFVGYPLYVWGFTKLSPITFIKKIGKVAMFGFSTSSSAATLPLNQKTTVESLGVSEDIASFVLPLGMTINMDGTAIMQVIAAIFIASVAGYPVTFSSVTVIAVLALIASVGTPAAPGAGAVILFTILSGMGYGNDIAIIAYSLILAINRPIEMLVTALNVVGDSTAAIIVANSEGTLDKDVYNDLSK